MSIQESASESEARTETDLALRAVTRLFPEDFARGFLPEGAVITKSRWIETQYAARERRLDRLLSLRVNRRARWMHNEWMLAWSEEVPARMFEYHFMAAMAAREHAIAVRNAARKTNAKALLKVPRVQSAVVVLTGPEHKVWPKTLSYRTSPRDERFSGVRFRVIAAYQCTVASLRAMGDMWLVFAPLATDASEGSLRELIEDIRARVEVRTAAELLAAMTILSEADSRKRGLREVITALLPQELTMHSTFLKEIFERGETKGKAEGEARAIIAVLEARAVAIPDDVRSEIMACQNLPTLDRWLKRALTAASARTVVRAARKTAD